MARMYAADVSVRACDHAIQIHGGLGLTEGATFAEIAGLPEPRGRTGAARPGPGPPADPAPPGD